jgi:hypothetical protein
MPGRAGVALSPLQQGYLLLNGKKLLKRVAAAVARKGEIQGRGRSRAEPATPEA